MNVLDSTDFVIPQQRNDDGIAEELVSLVSPASFAADQYLSLRNVVERLAQESGVRVIAITSPTPGDGKTVTALNVAGALAQSPDARVLLIDADLRKPSVSEYLSLNVARSRGLVDAIVDSTLRLEDVTRRVERLNLDVLQAGSAERGTYELLTSPRVETLMATARARYDHVIIDTAPLVPVPDSRLIGRCADAFLVVVAADKTPRRLLAEGLNLLDPAKVAGLVFNLDDRSSGYRNYYGYGYGRHSRPAKRTRGWWPWS